MSKIQHERDKVLRPALNSCKNLLRVGAILEYKRQDAFDYQHNNGSPDIEIRFIKENTLWLLMAECKRPDGKGVHLTSQKEYSNKYKNVKNVVYKLFESHKDLEKTIEDLTGFYKGQLNAIEI